MTNAERQTARIKQALHLIKIHINEGQTLGTDPNINRDLHAAIQLIVDVARIAGILESK